MGEVVMSCEGGMAMEEVARKEVVEGQSENKGQVGRSSSGIAAASSSSVVRWERFLPKMVVRVLLVEADDSTRQIIAALLRKCSYRVAAVPDGLKAWELLKGRPHNVDLILTEVDLPSISGFALLTLIMEHEVCKNLPVIMMSSQDSVSTVYKCMMHGAADFLVKPIRKNELRNLWQHVWRRQASSSGGGGGGGLGPPDDSVAQQRFEATAENNATSNRSSGYMASVQRNRERIEKGTDAQSSCARPETEQESEENEQDLSRPKAGVSLPNDIHMQQHEGDLQANNDLQMHDADAAGSPTAAELNCETLNKGEDMNIDDQSQPGKFTVDLIGAFDRCNYASSAPDFGANNTNSPPFLDLSLRRSHPSGSVNQGTDEGHRLNHSDASAFSRYVNKALQPQQSTSPSTCDQQKGNLNRFARQLSNRSPEYNSDAHDRAIGSQIHTLLVADGQGQVETAFNCPQKKALPAPVPVRGVRINNLSSAFGLAMPSMFCMQSGTSPLQSPGSACHQQAPFIMNSFHPLDQQQPRNSEQNNNVMNQSPNDDVTDQSENIHEHKLETFDDSGRFSSTDQSANSSFCNGTMNHLHNISYGSNGDVNTNPGIKPSSECGKEENFPTNDRHSHRSMQREAALTKFRLKRKERCYEKKVRYESRKKLAEQRPRVKGQFVRQMPNEPPPREML